MGRNEKTGSWWGCEGVKAARESWTELTELTVAVDLSSSMLFTDLSGPAVSDGFSDWEDTHTHTHTKKTHTRDYHLLLN